MRPRSDQERDGEESGTEGGQGNPLDGDPERGQGKQDQRDEEEHEI